MLTYAMLTYADVCRSISAEHLRRDKAKVDLRELTEKYETLTTSLSHGQASRLRQVNTYIYAGA